MRIALWVCVLAALAMSANAYFNQYRPAMEGVKVSDDATVRGAGLVVVPIQKTLAPGFTDSQGRLLADPPSDTSKLLDPPTIVIGRWESTDSDTPDLNWTAFANHISTEIGRKVQVIKYDNGPAQIEQIKKGDITLVALHAADVPFLVNNCGYQPAAVLADSANGVSGNHLDIIVPASSEINKTADIKGHTLVCTVPSSITGYRAAVATLMVNDGLRPNVDYFITWSLKQKAAIKAVVGGAAQAASVSDDKLNTLVASGKIEKSQYHMIYQSEVIPRMTIGWFYNLKPELAAKINAAIISYNPAEAASAKMSSAVADAGAAAQAPTTAPTAEDSTDTDANSASAMRWVATDYKKDFQFVRTIDNSFDPRLDTKAAK